MGFVTRNRFGKTNVSIWMGLWSVILKTHKTLQLTAKVLLIAAALLRPKTSEIFSGKNMMEVVQPSRKF